MLAAFFYQGDVPEPEALLDMARQCLVAEQRGALCADICKPLIDGLCTAWCAAREHQAEEGHNEPRFATAADAEYAFATIATKHHDVTVRLTHAGYERKGEPPLCWPEGLKYVSGWPVAFISKLAATYGEIEGTRSVAIAKYFEKNPPKKATP